MLDLFIRLFITLVVIADPFGNIPIFLSLTSNFNSSVRKRIITKAILISGLILIIFACLGQHILDWLNLSLSSFRISAGILLLIISLEIILGFPKVIQKEKDYLAFTPLAVPLIAGPGAIATVMIYTRQVFGVQRILVFMAIFLAMFFCWIVLINSEYLFKFLKTGGTQALAKIMGLILAALAVEMICSGIGEFFT